MICVFCKTRKATEKHHLFSQTKMNRKIYGKFLDEPFNVVFACNDCNGSHRNVITWNEREFRQAAKKSGYDLPPGSKSYRMKVWDETV